MHQHRWLFALFVGCFAIAEASCGSSSGSSRVDVDDDDGAGGSSASTGTADPSTSSSGGTGGSAGTCSKGGEPCLSFSECCSGECANQICSACGGVGEACGEGCCSGLTCFDGACSQCGPAGETCSLASDCCSNVCSQGKCGEVNCVSCSDYFANLSGPLCSASQPFWDYLEECLCSICGGPCAEFCVTRKDASFECITCVDAANSNECADAYSGCMSDM